MDQFIHLRARSDYSLGHSITKIHDLVSNVVESEMPAVCLMDYGNLFGSLEFSMECIKKGVKPIIGCELRVEHNLHGTRTPEKKHSKVSLIAKNKTGYQNLLYLVSQSYLQNVGTLPHIKVHQLINYAEGLILLLDCFSSPVGQLINAGQNKQGIDLLAKLQKCFHDNLFLELIRTKKNDWQNYERALLDIAFEKNIPIVATNPITFLKPALFDANDALLCISESTYLLAENRTQIDPDSYFKSANEMRELFDDLPEAIENTTLIALKASVMAETRKPMLPKFSQEIDDEAAELRIQAHAGLTKRLAQSTKNLNQDEYFARLEFELNVINNMKFPGYFLIVSDFIKWSKKNHISVGPGRGSGAGSVVAWALEITDLDPIQFGLLFERFLNPERVSMPDFDIDFCQERRDEVIHYVENKYGKERVAQIITFGKLQARAVLRDVGRVMQIPYGLVDKICKMVPNNPAHPVTLSEAIMLDKTLQNMRDENPDINKLFSISLELEGINRHVSTHAAGIIIADKPLIELVPLYIDANASMQTIQYSLKYADAAGLMKFDFLGLKTLTLIDQTIKLIKENRNVDVTFSTDTFDDKETFAMLARGETAGVFQFEGAGVKDAMKRLKPDCLEDLIALTSLYRPGPMDNIPGYINRKHGLEKPDYIHPRLEPILKETYGIIIYQEQVMKIAQVLAGYSLGEADLLRRAMGKKNKREMEEQRTIFITGCKKSDISKERATEIFALIDKFASYGFNKSHAAAYAIISYQTAYLKAHYPSEFFTASMNLDIHDTSKLGAFCSEAKHLGINVLTPCINRSHDYFVVEDGNIRYALGAIKGVGIKAMSEMQKVRMQNTFNSIETFFDRCQSLINKRALENLVKAGAFDSLHPNRGELYHNLEGLIKYNNEVSQHTQQPSLFASTETKDEIKFSFTYHQDWDSRQKLNVEFEALGFYLSSHPLDEYEKRLEKIGTISAAVLDTIRDKGTHKYRIAGVVTSKKIRSSKRGKYAFVQLADKAGIVDAAIFNQKLLLESSELLQDGNAVICNVEVIQDDLNRRVIIESVDALHNYMSKVAGVCKIYIASKEVIPEIFSNLSPHGLSVKLYVELNDKSLVQFATQDPLFINMQALAKLKNINNVRIVEE